MDMSHDTRLTTRFFKKVDTSGDCHEWTASKMTGGYGLFVINYKNCSAHRVAYEIAYGPFDPAMHVDHICHNRGCVNPKHLRLATRVQNAENRAGAAKHNKSCGIRGVSWNIGVKKWIVTAGHEGKKYYGGIYDDLAEAEQAAIALRMRLHTFNYLDRLAS
jgi:hypothetical protein